MAKSTERILFSALAITLGACSAARPEPRGVVARPEASQAAPIRETAPEPVRIDPGRNDEPVEVLTLRDALARVLAGSPELSAFNLGLRAAEARALQARLYPNPEANLTIEDFGGTGSFAGFDEAETTLELGQLIELGGKRAARMRVAAAGADLAGWDYEIARIEILGRTARRFLDLLQAQEEVALAQQAIDLSNEVVAAARRRVEAGSGSDAELARALLTGAEAALEQERTARWLDFARRRLCVLWGASVPNFDRAQEARDRTEPIPSLDDLVHRLESAPELLRWGTELMRRNAIVDAQRADSVPDLTPVLGYRRAEGAGDHAFVAGLSAPLPLWNRNQGLILEARRKHRQAEARRASDRLQIATTLAAAHRDLEIARAEIEALEGAILPAAERVFDSLRSGYRGGRFPYIEVLEAQRTLTLARARRLRARFDFHRAIVDIETLLGAPLRTPAPSITEGAVR